VAGREREDTQRLEGDNPILESRRLLPEPEELEPTAIEAKTKILAWLTYGKSNNTPVSEDT